tara:strand:+ start:146 stop:331 length:186 start_codon:yes stop_codon:yes gene_type:complete
MSKEEVLRDFEKILELSIKYCSGDNLKDRELNEFVENLAQQINAKAHLVKKRVKRTSGNVV